MGEHLIFFFLQEQLVAGIKGIKVDEGYIDSTSFPGKSDLGNELSKMYLPFVMYFSF